MPPRSQPQTKRCRYAAGQKRCRRIATVSGQLCRHHALEIEAELGATASSFTEMVDRWLSRQDNPITSFVDGLMGAFFGQARPEPVSPPRSSSSPPRPGARARRAPPPPPRRPPPPPDPTIAARKVMGFGAAPLTIEMVRERRKELAKRYHPDRPGGSTAKMQRINEAADVLLASLG